MGLQWSSGSSSDDSDWSNSSCAAAATSFYLFLAFIKSEMCSSLVISVLKSWVAAPSSGSYKSASVCSSRCLLSCLSCNYWKVPLLRLSIFNMIHRPTQTQQTYRTQIQQTQRFEVNSNGLTHQPLNKWAALTGIYKKYTPLIHDDNIRHLDPAIMRALDVVPKSYIFNLSFYFF